MHIPAYVIFCLEAWPHVSKALFHIINVCIYVHMWYIAWRHDPMYLRQYFVLLMYACTCICEIACRHDPMYLRRCFVFIINVCICNYMYNISRRHDPHVSWVLMILNAVFIPNAYGTYCLETWPPCILGAILLPENC
jgi:hypothetical protein